MTERQEQCETCRWWRMEFDYSEEEGEAIGCCKRFPPVLSLFESDIVDWDDSRGETDPMRADHSFMHWVQPRTMCDDFCGEWQPATPAVDNPLLASPVTSLNLSVRARNTLRRLRVVTVADLTTKTDQDLLSTQHCGLTTVGEILMRLRERGLDLAR